MGGLCPAVPEKKSKKMQKNPEFHITVSFSDKRKLKIAEVNIGGLSKQKFDELLSRINQMQFEVRK